MNSSEEAICVHVVAVLTFEQLEHLSLLDCAECIFAAITVIRFEGEREQTALLYDLILSLNTGCQLVICQDKDSILVEFVILEA